FNFLWIVVEQHQRHWLGFVQTLQIQQALQVLLLQIRTIPGPVRERLQRLGRSRDIFMLDQFQSISSSNVAIHRIEIERLLESLGWRLAFFSQELSQLEERSGRSLP